MAESIWRKIWPQNRSTTRSHDADALLVYRTLHEDKEVFGLIVAAYTPIFYSLIKRMTPNRSPESIEDDLQEIFLRIYRALPTFRDGNSFFSWAYTIAMNWTRSQQRKAWSAKSDYNIPYDEENAGLQGNRYRETPEDTAIAVEAEQLLLQALQELKNSYREVFILRMVEGLSVSETAKILKIPEGTVKTYLHRGRQKLRHWLLKHDWNLKE